MRFPIFDKIEVNGPNAHPVYKFLKTHHPGDVRWSATNSTAHLVIPLACRNFEKFLLTQDGVVFRRYPSRVSPNELDSTIASFLENPAAAAATSTESDSQHAKHAEL